MPFCDIFTLRSYSLIKIATTIWKFSHNIDKFIESIENIDTWSQVEFLCNTNVEKLVLPNAFIELVKKFIRPMGIELFRFMKLLYTISTDYQYLLSGWTDIIWTSQGMVEAEETAKRIVGNICIAPSIRFKMACYFCLLSEISSLWDQLHSYTKEESLVNSMIVKEHECLWTKYMLSLSKEENSNLLFEQILESGIYLAIEHRNKVAVQNYWKLMSFKTRRKCFLNCLNKISYIYHIEGDGCFFPNVTSCNATSVRETIVFLLLQANANSLSDESDRENISDGLRIIIEWTLLKVFIKICRFSPFQITMANGNVNILLRQKILSAIDVKSSRSFLKFQRNIFYFTHSDINLFCVRAARNKPFFVSNLLSDLLIEFDYMKVTDGQSLIFDSLNPKSKQKLATSLQSRLFCEILAIFELWNLLSLFIDHFVAKDKIEEFSSLFQKSVISAQLIFKPTEDLDFWDNDACSRVQDFLKYKTMKQI